MKVNVMSRKLIKPCTPTPENRNKYKISFTDELIPPMNISATLFYPPNPKPKPAKNHLQESLAEILPQFYLFAGRYIKNNHLVDCNDEGVELVEAEIEDNIEMMDMIKKSKSEQILNYDLLSRQAHDMDKATDPLLSIQITEFKCGGLVISVSISHRVADAFTLGTFIAAWSNSNNPDGENIFSINSPSFDSPSLFPGRNFEFNVDQQPEIIVVKRLLFNKEAITSLKSKIRPKNGKRFLSRVRVVSALIAKALIGVDLAKNGKPRACFAVQAVNMRERTIPPMPKYSCGNLGTQSVTQCTDANETKEINMGLIFEELVHQFGDAIDKTVTGCAEILSLGEDERNKFVVEPGTNLFERFKRGENINVLWFSDWSKFGFYESDFGWGKPIWAGIGTFYIENLTVLMDNKEGNGIEAWVHLNTNDVPYFEQDEDMKMFTIA